MCPSIHVSHCLENFSPQTSPSGTNYPMVGVLSMCPPHQISKFPTSGHPCGPTWTRFFAYLALHGLHTTLCTLPHTSMPLCTPLHPSAHLCTPFCTPLCTSTHLCTPMHTLPHTSMHLHTSPLSWDALRVDLVCSDDHYCLPIPPLFRSDLVHLSDGYYFSLFP